MFQAFKTVLFCPSSACWLSSFFMSDSRPVGFRCSCNSDPADMNSSYPQLLISKKNETDSFLQPLLSLQWCVFDAER